MSGREIRAGRAFVSVSLKDKTFRGQLSDLSNRMKSFGGQVASIGTAFAGAGIATLTPLIAATTKFASQGAEIAKVANRIGTSAESLSALGYAADKVGAPVDRLHEGMTELVQRLGEASATGTGSAADQLKLLGLSADELVKKDPVTALGEITDAINALPTEGERAFAFDELMGGDSRELLEVLSLGSKGMAEMRTEAESLGLVMSGADAKAAKKFQGSLNLLKGSLNGIVMQVGGALAPAITDVSQLMTKGASFVLDFIKENRELVVTVAKVAGGLAVVGGGILGIGGLITGAGFALSGIISLFGALGAMASGGFAIVAGAVGLIFSPVVLVSAAIAGLVALVVHLTGSGGKLKDIFNSLKASLVATFGPTIGAIVDGFKKTFGGVVDAVKAGDLGLAFEIAMAGAEVAFREGISMLANAWGGFLPGLVEAFAGAMGTINRLWLDTQAKISEGIFNVIVDTQIVGDDDLTISEKATQLEDRRQKEVADGYRNQIERNQAIVSGSSDSGEIAEAERKIAFYVNELSKLGINDVAADIVDDMNDGVQEAKDQADEYWATLGESARTMGKEAKQQAIEAQARLDELSKKAESASLDQAIGDAGFTLGGLLAGDKNAIKEVKDAATEGIGKVKEDMASRESKLSDLDRMIGKVGMTLGGVLAGDKNAIKEVKDAATAAVDEGKKAWEVAKGMTADFESGLSEPEQMSGQVAGTFSVEAAVRLGMGSPDRVAERTAKAAESQLDELQGLRVDVGNLNLPEFV